jgi:lysyl-tRNA synthetase class 1
VGFISRYAPGVTAETHPKLDALVGYAIRYFDDFVKPTKSFRAPDDTEREALANSMRLRCAAGRCRRRAIQDAALDVARGFERYQDHNKKGPDGGPGVSVAWFSALYQLLLGQEKGPRFGSFVALYGISETRAMISKALAGNDR